jgi:anthranilate phosphoribosyltransferase
MAEALIALGADRAMVVHSADGLDEISTTAQTIAASIERGSVTMQTIDPAALGVESPAGGLAALQATDLDDARRRIEGVLTNEPGFECERDLACLNAGGALLVAGVASDLADGLSRAQEAVRSGAAMTTLQTLASVSQG